MSITARMGKFGSRGYDAAPEHPRGRDSISIYEYTRAWMEPWSTHTTAP